VREKVTVRFAGIDSFRVVAIIAVITIHTRPFENLPTVGGVIDQIARFAVLYFLVISGFLYGKRILRTGNPGVVFTAHSKRISLIFIFWSAFYLFAPKYSLISKHGYIEGMYQSIAYRLSLVYECPLHALLTGTSIHLWFLPALLFGVAILTIGVTLKKENMFLCFAILLYMVGLLADPYSATQFGITVPFEEKRLLFAPIFVIAGFVLAKIS
jgi:surface polysaccharide O-acyltransferase-like enzyme